MKSIHLAFSLQFGGPSADNRWLFVRALLNFVLGGCFVCATGRLNADPIFEGRKLFGDVTPAKVVSGIDLFTVGTNLWSSALEERAGKYLLRAALDKTRYRIGEPVHLFLYRQQDSSEPTICPKAAGWEIIRPVIVDHRNRPVPLTAAGRWHASIPNPHGFGGQPFRTNIIDLNQIDLAELAALTEPGRYLVFPRILLNLPSSDPNEPESAELRAIQFEVTTNRFERPADSPPSSLMNGYQEHLDKVAGRSRPLSELEKELSAQAEQMMKEAMERDRPLMEEFFRKTAATNPPVAPPMGGAPEPQRIVAGSSLRWFGLPLFGGVTALLCAFWLLRRRGD